VYKPGGGLGHGGEGVDMTEYGGRWQPWPSINGQSRELLRFLSWLESIEYCGLWWEASSQTLAKPKGIG
jgi:hypothetical protein